MIGEVERRGATSLTVRAQNVRSQIAELWRHDLSCKPIIQSLEIRAHVTEGLGAYGTGIVHLDILFVAVDVHAVPTGQKHDRGGRREHEVGTNGTVRFQRALNALVLAE